MIDRSYYRDIEEALKPAGRRALGQHYLNFLLKALIAGLAVASLIRLGSFFIPWEAAPRCMAEFSAGVLTLAVFMAWARRPGIYEIACLVDEQGLKERLSTALELNGLESEMIRRQRQDALEQLRLFNLEQHFTVKVPRREGSMLISGFLITALLFCLPNPQQSELDRRAAIKREIAVQEKKIEAVKKELQKPEQPEIDKPKQQALASLQELQEGLRDAGDLKTALKALARAESKLGQLQVAEIERERATSSAAPVTSTSAPHSPASANNQNGNPSSAAQGPSGQTGGAAGITSELNEAARAVADSRAALLAAANNSAGGTGPGNGSEGEGNSGGEGGLASGSGASPNSPGNGSQASGASGDGNSGGEGGQQGQGNSGGAGNGNNGSPGSGSGAGQGTGNGSESPGRMAAGGNPAGGDSFPAMNYREYEKIYDPARIGAEGQTSVVHGQEGEGPEQKLETDDPAVMNQARRPYHEVLAQYSQAARDSLGRNPIPAGMSEVVKNYFAALEE